MFLLTQLHWGACLVDRMLAGAQAVFQLGGGSLWRRGGTDAVKSVGWVYQWGARTGRRGPRGSWRRGVWDFTCHLTAATSSSSWAGQTRAPSSTNSKWSPSKKKGESDIDFLLKWLYHLITAAFYCTSDPLTFTALKTSVSVNSVTFLLVLH